MAEPNAVACQDPSCAESGVPKWAGLADLDAPVTCGACGRECAVLPDPIPVPDGYRTPDG